MDAVCYLSIDDIWSKGLQLKFKKLSQIEL